MPHKYFISDCPKQLNRGLDRGNPQIAQIGIFHYNFKTSFFFKLDTVNAFHSSA
jgi:hypothetical protein